MNKIKLKSAFEQILIVFVSSFLTVLVDTLPQIQWILGTHIDPIYLWPTFMIIGIVIRKRIQSIEQKQGK